MSGNNELILRVKTVDGSVDGYPFDLLVSNGTLTDNRDGTFTLVNIPSVTAPLSISGSTISLDYDSTDFQLNVSDELQIKDSGIDHGSISGLSDDDHTQYLLTNGTRDLTGNWTISTNNITLTAGNLTAIGLYGELVQIVDSGETVTLSIKASDDELNFVSTIGIDRYTFDKDVSFDDDIRVYGDAYITTYGNEMVFGSTNQGSLTHNGVHLYCNPAKVGSGALWIDKGGFTGETMNSYTFYGAIITNRTTSNAQQAQGAWIGCQWAGTSSNTYLITGFNSYAYITGTGALTRTTWPGGAAGGLYEVQLKANSTVSMASGLALRGVQTTGTYSEYDDIHIWNLNKTGGTLTLLNGIKIDALTAGVTNWGINDAGNDWYLNGKLCYGQTDKNEYWGSLNDGYLDGEATTGIRFRINATEQINLVDGKLAPTTDNDIDFGDSTHRLKDIYNSNRIIQNSILQEYTGSKVLTNNSPTGILDIAIATGEFLGGYIVYSIYVADGTDFQSHSGTVAFNAINKAATVTSDIEESYIAASESEVVSAGTLTDAWTITDGSGKITINCNANSSLSPSANYPVIKYTLFLHSINIITPL